MHCSPRLLGQCGWVIGRILFYVQWTKRRSSFIETQKKKKKKKGRRLKSPILTEQVWTTTWPKKIALIRIKNDLFLSRKPPVFIVQ